MNLFDLNSDKIIYNIDGKDIEMKYPICFGKDVLIINWRWRKIGGEMVLPLLDITNINIVNGISLPTKW